MALRVQAAGNESGTVTLNGVEAGDLIVVCVRERDGDAVTVSDSVNGSHGGAASAPVTVGQCRIFYFENSGAGNLVVTVAGGTVRDFNASAWSGYATSSALSEIGSVTNSGTTSQTHDDTGITPASTALIITAWTGTENASGTVTPHTGFTALTVNPSGSAPNRQYYAYKEAHTGAINPTHTSGTSITTNACCASFLAAEVEAETITLDKWLGRQEVRQGVKAVMVASGMTPPDRND